MQRINKNSGMAMLRNVPTRLPIRTTGIITLATGQLMTVQFFYGCFSQIEKKKNLVIAPAKIVALLTAIASRVLNPKKAIEIGIINPPPPIPAILQSPRRMGSTMLPTISYCKIGNKFLCKHAPSKHRVYGYPSQSNFVSHCYSTLPACSVPDYSDFRLS